MITLFWLLVGHAVCDYPWQGDFLARGKNHRQPLDGIPWQWCLVWHSLIHGGAVAYVTGSVQLGLIEYSVHCLIDYLKCDGRTSFNTDQWLHVACKVVWALVIVHSR
jgi:hypothetical protein